MPMNAPLQVTFRGMSSTPAHMNAVREQHEKLVAACEGVTGCHVVISPPPHGHEHVGVFAVHLTFTVRGSELTVGHTHETPDPAHRDFAVALRDAYSDARARLHAMASKRRASHRPAGP